MGCDVTRWTPKGSGTLHELSSSLEPLAPVKEHVTAITNLELRNAYPGTHATSNAAFLSAATAKLTESSDYYLGTTVDQIAAKAIGAQTQLPSLELSMDLLSLSGQCDNGYACVYQNNLSWSSPTTPLPAEAHPRVVFERLFGDGGNSAERRASLQRRASLLDSVAEEMARLQNRLGPADRQRVAEYLDAVREVERRIEKAEADASDNPLPDLDRPTGVPTSYADHARLMFDLQRLAWQGDVTRVTTFMLGREFSGRTYPEIGVPDAHHPISHHQRDPVRMEKCAKINHYHVSLFAEFVESLRNTPDGDGTLLDHATILYGAGMSEGNGHVPRNLPLLLVGGGSGRLKSGRHIKYADGTPMANMHLSLLDKLGVRVEAHGNSTGPVSLD
jgi:hypothetical protein